MFKRLKFFLALILLNIVFIDQSYATSSGSGRFHITGIIVDTACAIDTESMDQTIDMGAVPISLMLQNGLSNKKDFSINLINCILKKSERFLSSKQHFTVTFDGYNDDGIFGIEGTAKGVAMRISDSEGHIAIPGKPLPAGDVDTTEMSLKYSLQLVRDNEKLRAGDYKSTIKFKMDYY